GDVDLLGRDAGLRAPRDELVAVGRVVLGRRDEQAARVLDGVGGDPPQHDVLLDALDGGVRVLDRVAPAGVQQAVEAARGPLGEVPAFGEDRVEPAQRAVPGDGGAGGASADDQHVGLHRGHGAEEYDGAEV